MLRLGISISFIIWMSIVYSQDSIVKLYSQNFGMENYQKMIEEIETIKKLRNTKKNSQTNLNTVKTLGEKRFSKTHDGRDN